MYDLSNDVKFVKGVGPNRAKTLNKMGIYNIEDLITYFPRNYEDRGNVKKIADLKDDEKVCIEGRAIVSPTNRYLGKNRSIQKVIITDETDNCTITWFNQPYISKQIKMGEKYRFYGKVNTKGFAKEMNSPVFDPINKENNTGKIIPLYPLVNGITQNNIRKIIQNGRGWWFKRNYAWLHLEKI